MAEKIAKTQIKIDEGLQYYIKNGDIWARPRAQPKGKSHKVANAGILMENDRYLYYVDSDGDVARTDLNEQLDIIRRAVGRVDAFAAAVSQGFDPGTTQLDRFGHLVEATALAAATAVNAVDRFCAMMAERATLNTDSRLSEDDLMDPESDA
jgi:hypothetical protein